jgi:hypothetical protein
MVLLLLLSSSAVVQLLSLRSSTAGFQMLS